MERFSPQTPAGKGAGRGPFFENTSLARGRTTKVFGAWCWAVRVRSRTTPKKAITPYPTSMSISEQSIQMRGGGCKIAPRQHPRHLLRGRSLGKVACVLDPRFKAKRELVSAFSYALLEQEEAIYKARLQAQRQTSASATEIVAEETATTPERPRDHVSAQFDELSDEDEAVAGQEKTETAIYQAMPPIPKDADPLQFWEEHKTKLPTLFILACVYLCIMGTSCASERVFSQAGLMVTPLRNSLSPGLVQKMMFIKMNKDLWPDVSVPHVVSEDFDASMDDPSALMEELVAD
eukprot:jgi/Mesvir1/21936/Mv25317-RA.1